MRTSKRDNKCKKDIETTINSQSKVKNTISEMKNILEGINSRLDEAVNSISDMEDKLPENT